MSNLVSVRSAGACSHIDDIVIPGVYFYSSSPNCYFLTSFSLILARSHRKINRNVVNISTDVFPRIIVHIWSLDNFFYNFDYFSQKSRKLHMPAIYGKDKLTLNIQVGMTSFLYKTSRQFLFVWYGYSGSANSNMLSEFSREQRELPWQPNIYKRSQNCTDFSSVSI